MPGLTLSQVKDRVEAGPEDILETAQWCERRANEAVMILRLNENIISCLQRFYTSLLVDPRFTMSGYPYSPACRTAVENFTQDLGVLLDEKFKPWQSRAELQAKDASDAKTLVRLREDPTKLSLTTCR